MSDTLSFDRSEPLSATGAEWLRPTVRRIIAPNSGPFTFTGTCSYLVGTKTLAIIDPGPDDERHLATLLAAIGSATVSHIFVTHTHRDHSPLARPLAELTGALIVGCSAHRSARPLNLGEINPLDASSDQDYAPDHMLVDGDTITGPDWTLTALDTPGHAANHVSFALAGEAALFSGDHVMAWSTSIVAPPDGSMGDYMRSLQKLLGRSETVYWPGHGNPVIDPQRFVRGLLQHRRQREASVLDRLKAGDRTIPEIVRRVYTKLAPELKPAAALSVFAQLEDMVERGLVLCEGSPALDGTYWPNQQ